MYRRDLSAGGETERWAKSSRLNNSCNGRGGDPLDAAANGRHRVVAADSFRTGGKEGQIPDAHLTFSLYHDRTRNSIPFLFRFQRVIVVSSSGFETSSGLALRHLIKFSEMELSSYDADDVGKEKRGVGNAALG